MKKIPFNENFFTEDNDRSFYWAGLLAADGCIRNKISKFKSGSQSKVKEVSIGLIDKELIEQFLIDINGVGRKISENHYKTLKGTSTSYILRFNSAPLYDSLLRFGITEVKSKTLKMPEWLKTHSLINHFIRGYFDGDGSVFYQHNTKYIEFRGTVSFLESINEIIKSNICKQTKAQVHVHSNCGSLKYCGNILTMEVANFLYKDASVCLKRKYDKLMHNMI